MRFLVKALTAVALALPLYIAEPTADPGALAQTTSSLTADDEAEIRRIISAQIAAFGSDDAERAFSYAAPRIASQFGSPERFLRMVREHYDPVYRPREVAFREIDERGHLPTQIVLVVDQQGQAHIALYPMERQDDGTWRIAGCLLQPAPDDAAT